LLASGFMIALTHESRYLYLMPTLAAVGVAVWIARVPSVHLWLKRRHAPVSVRLVGIGLLVTLAAVQLQGGLSVFDQHRDFYGVLTPGVVEAIEAADDYAGDTGVIAVPSLGDAPIGWWVEALSSADVIYGSPLRWLNFPNEVERATLANTIFDLSFPDPSTLDTLADESISVLIIPTRWAWFDEDAIVDWVHDNDLQFLVRDHDAFVVAIN
jgi:hypothetical protein